MTSPATEPLPATMPSSAWREPWVWLIVGIPAATVVAGFVTWWIAAQRADSNVVEDYYKRGLTVNRSIEREERAAQLGLSARIELRDGDDLRVRLSAAPGLESDETAPREITVLLTHPVRAEHDQRLALARQADGEYRIRSPGVKAGTWDLAIETAQWRLAARRVSLSETQALQLAPAPAAR